MGLVSVTALLIRSLTDHERRFLEDVLLPAALQDVPAREAVNRWAKWARETSIGVIPNRGLPHTICAALVGLEFDGAQQSPAYGLLHRAHRLVYSMDATAWRRGPDFYHRLVTAR